MKRYFTTITIANDGYIGKVLDPNTNQTIYTTQTYANQIEATSDVANYLKTATSIPTAPDNYTPPQPINQTPVRRKCCGR